MKSTIKACKDCTDRHPGCHDKCPKYQEEKQEFENRKSEVRKAAEDDYRYVDYMMKRGRYKGGKRKW